MKFAVISDVHGNLPALDAILEDAERNNVDNFIFAGDYCLSNPFPDECITRIRNLGKKYVIRGNEESYLENLIGKDPGTWLDGQFQISYWCYRNISPENLNYLLSCPNRMKLTFNDVPINISHSSADFIADSEHRKWGPVKVAQRYEDTFLSQAALSRDMHNDLENDRQFNERLDALPDGVYIFGHTHIQWSYKSSCGKKVLINPGSSGLPLDCMENSVPYTILDISDPENILVEDKRVPFNKDEYIQSFIQSDQFMKASVWSKIIVKELKMSREYLTFFLQYVEEYAKKIGDDRRPFSVSTWERAFELWEKNSC